MSSTYDEAFLLFQQTCADSVYTVSSKFNHSRTKPPQDESDSFCVHLAPDCFLIGKICCDGHGVGGEVIAKIGIMKLKAHFGAKTIAYASLDQREVYADITMAFESIQQAIYDTRMPGGSTCFVAWSLVWADGRDTDVHVANIGDSPVFAITPTEVVRMTIDDSPTNKEEAERLMALSNGDGLIPVYADRQSNYNSPPVFRKVQRDDAIHLELDVDTPIAIGLKSTLRSGEMPTYWVNKRTACNMVCIAVSRTFGNNDKRRNGMISTPHLRSFRVTPGQQVYIFGCSDGWMDAHYEDHIGHIIRSTMASSATTQDAATALVAQGFQSVISWQKELSKCATYPDGYDYPLEQVHVGWDDVTCTIMDVSKWPARREASVASQEASLASQEASVASREASVDVSLTVSDGEINVSIAVKA